MNLNEECLLNYLQNPDELQNLTGILEENIKLLKESSLLAVASITV